MSTYSYISDVFKADLYLPFNFYLSDRTVKAAHRGGFVFSHVTLGLVVYLMRRARACSA